MNKESALALVERTLRAGEAVAAFGHGVDVNSRGLRFPDSNPNTWIGVTGSRYIEVSVGSGKVVSWFLPDVKKIELHRSVLGGTKLHFNPSGAPDSMGLSVYKIDKDLAAGLAQVLPRRGQALVPPKETTSYEKVEVEVVGGIAALTGPTSVEYHCVRCGGDCGLEMMGKVEVFERCQGCLRGIDGATD